MKTLFLAMLLLSSIAQAASDEVKLQFAGTTRSYLVHLPKGFSAIKPYPLLLAFHPNHGRAEGMRVITGFDALADKNNFIVAYPDSDPNFKDGRSWNTRGPDNDVDFAMAVLADIQAKNQIAPGKVFAAGFSLGAGMVEQLACHHTKSFAGAGIVSANLNPRAEALCHPSAEIPTVHFHGTADPISPYAGGINNGENKALTSSAQHTAEFWVKANGCAPGSKPVVSEIPDTLILDAASSRTKSVKDSLQAWDDCSVHFYTITGGGHTWPGTVRPVTGNGPKSRDLDASGLMVEFFGVGKK